MEREQAGTALIRARGTLTQQAYTQRAGLMKHASRYIFAVGSLPQQGGPDGGVPLKGLPLGTG